MSQPDRDTRRPLLHRLRWVGGAFLFGAVVVVAHGVISRAAQSARLRALTEAQAVPTVAIVTPTDAQDHAGLELPGRLEAYIRAPIYARVPGYLKSWRHDIGDKVKAGDVLAEIDTPDLDQQLTQARADLSVARANAKLAKISAERWQSLAGTDAVAQQDVDQRTFTLNANIAQVKAAQASVDRLIAEEGFKHLIAPFDGVVTARETDIGALINVGAAGGAELFVVSDTSKLRVYVNVPQNYVPSVPPGTKATIRVPEHSDKTYNGTVEASAQAVNASSGTTLMQLIVDNSAGEMMPGDYASIRLQIAAGTRVLRVPSSALIFDAKGLSIATVDADNHVLIKPVSLARDLGAVVEIASGLTANDRVIENPPDGIGTGASVRLTGVGPLDADARQTKHQNEKG
ncbi:MAG TPA: efflux RND transporter periplasmic adaptor subunit [Steroidobacteraceae bacterium]|jgi:RND family efflux transporter MFP subunit|nr:efflux RND transporter periplasmic adaptor subunit [Steroidobacteraceae bacterium]